MLQHKKILIGITGSIAAYKSILLVRLLVKAGAEVRVVMTPAAREFVSPLVLATLSGNKTLVELSSADEWSNHVMLGRWADVFVIAPLSCNTLGKMAHGLCDNLLMAVYLSATCPVVVAPAMDEDMWHHAATKRNIELLCGFGTHMIPVDNGELASGLFGDGRMAEPEAIQYYLSEHFFRGNRLAGKKAVVTAGPTYEAIDPVRFIGNHSSGKMGFAIAEALYMEGADVALITGPTHEQMPYKGIQVTHVTNAEQMFNAAVAEFPLRDIGVMSAAVADFKPETEMPEKIKKAGAAPVLSLVRTQDILKRLGEIKKEGQFLVGFALETQDEVPNAMEKLRQKNADCIVLNSLRDENAGFGFDTNKVTILNKDTTGLSLGPDTKKNIAKEIVSFIASQIHV